LERRISPGEDIELHFQSKNPEEQNGAVIFTYQSSIPAFRGHTLSHELSLISTSAIRLLCHILKEPLFDELRTKQQLGYIVQAYYENGFSSRQPGDASNTPFMVPVDFITINILSRKVSPLDVTERIDDFLKSFRESLVSMPESEIRSHANALCTKLLKPIQKLLTEANDHFYRIHRYAPECFYSDQQDNLPWDTAEVLARSIQKIERKELLEAWDRMIDPSSRSRVVSCVYGNTFPLEESQIRQQSKKVSGMTSLFARRPSPVIISNNFSKIIEQRQQMAVFDSRITPTTKRSISTRISHSLFCASSSSSLLSFRTAVPIVSFGVISFAGLLGWTFLQNPNVPSTPKLGPSKR
jgi:hypothetical protein